MRRLVFVLACLLMAGPLAAQTVITAQSGVAFTPSPDHAAMAEDGTTPLVDHYELQIITNANGALAFTQGLLKPAPNAAGEIVVQPISSFATLTRGVIYVATVSAVGPGGVGVSARSETFLSPFAPPASPGAPGQPRILR